MAWQGKRSCSPSYVDGENWWQSFVRASYKTDGAANEDAVEIKFALLYKIYSGLIDKTGLNDINSSNERVVTVTSLIIC